MSDPDRSGLLAPFPPGLTVVVIDHHRTNPGWGTINLVDPGACATTAVLADLFLRLGEPIDAALATCLLTGIMTDTGFFAYAQGARPFALAATLIERGADQAGIRKALERRSNVPLTRALGEALSTVQIFTEPPMAIFTVPWRPDGQQPLTTEPGPLIAYANRLGGVDVSAVLIEEAPGRVHLELRARRPGVDVGAIALRLGGGGHIAAAGATLTGSLDDAVAQLRAALTGGR